MKLQVKLSQEIGFGSHSHMTSQGIAVTLQTKAAHNDGAYSPACMLQSCFIIFSTYLSYIFFIVSGKNNDEIITTYQNVLEPLCWNNKLSSKELLKENIKVKIHFKVKQDWQIRELGLK